MNELYKNLFLYKNETKSFFLNEKVLTDFTTTHDVKILIQFIQIISQQFVRHRRYQLINGNLIQVIHNKSQKVASSTQIGSSSTLQLNLDNSPVKQIKVQVIKLQEEVQEIEFSSFFNELKASQLLIIIKRLTQIRRKFRWTFYSLKICEMIHRLKKMISDNTESQSLKKQEEGQTFIGDFDIKQQDYIKSISTSNILSNIKGVVVVGSHKNIQISKLTTLLIGDKFTNFSSYLKFLSIQIIPLLEKQILNIPLHNHKERQTQIYKSLEFITKMYVMQYQIQIEINKNTIVQTRIYLNKVLKETLLFNHGQIIRAIRKICNEGILCPSNNCIQILVLRVLRRLYCLHDYQFRSKSESRIMSRQKICQLSQNQESVTNKVRNPLFLTIRNIALFGGESQESIKQAAMLCYKILYDKNDTQLIQMLQSCDEIRLLKNSKYYSSKAYAYPDEIQKIYEPNQISNLYPKQHRVIPPRQLWTINILVQKPSSLLSWQFYITSYDIKFGIFKVDDLKDLTLPDYDGHVGCKQVLKFQKVRNVEGSPNVGYLYLKNGLYRMVFDNSFSMIRSKELFYNVLHLQSGH